MVGVVIRHLIFLGGPKGDHNFDNHPYVYMYMYTFLYLSYIKRRVSCVLAGLLCNMCLHVYIYTYIYMYIYICTYIYIHEYILIYIRIVIKSSGAVSCKLIAVSGHPQAPSSPGWISASCCERIYAMSSTSASPRRRRCSLANCLLGT